LSAVMALWPNCVTMAPTSLRTSGSSSTTRIVLGPVSGMPDCIGGSFPASTVMFVNPVRYPTPFERFALEVQRNDAETAGRQYETQVHTARVVLKFDEVAPCRRVNSTHTFHLLYRHTAPIHKGPPARVIGVADHGKSGTGEIGLDNHVLRQA